MTVHARTEVGDDDECPALTGAVQLQHLLLALQIRVQIKTRHARMRDRAASCWRSMVRLGTQSSEIIAPLAALRKGWDKLAADFPTPQVLAETPKTLAAVVMGTNLFKLNETSQG